MSKSIIAIETPENCIECPFCYKSGEMMVRPYEYRHLYSCRFVPENVEDICIGDILNGKPDWCPLKELQKANHPDYCDNGRYDKGWNDCIDEILEEKKE